jgi:glycosyl transferase family 25
VSALLRRVPQRYRLRLWLLRDYLRPESYRRRRAQPSVARRLAARAVIARRRRLLVRPAGVDRLSAVRVINLDSRPDRLASFEAEMARLGIERVERFEAITRDNGALGCSLSHRECLTQMLERGWESVMVCEDDARFLVDRGGLDVLVDDFLDDPSAEVACLAYFVWESRPHDALYLRGFRVQTTACYVIKASIGEELLGAWQEGIEGLKRGESPKQYGCDRIWMPLQRRRIFVVPAIRAAYQEPGYSDVEGRVVGYTH